MPDKMKRNRFGRQVTKTERYIGEGDMGTPRPPAKLKTKTVRKGNQLKTRQVVKQYNGERTVNKTKKYETGDTSVTKRTVRGNLPGLNKGRSVTTKSPGYTSTTTNMGPVSQGKLYRRQVKKIK